MAPGLDLSRPFVPLGIAVLTVSDTRSAADDRSGDWLAGAVAAAGHRLAARRIARDDASEIGAVLDGWIEDDDIAVILAAGGTGLTGRDVTPEACRPRFDKEIDGFAALWHAIAYDIVGASTIQSRACAGLAGQTYLFCLPGSPGACRDAWEKILVHQLDNRFRPCNLVEIRPRLGEK